MSVSTKICGIQDEAALIAAIEGGASHVGFVFFKRSRNVVSSGVAASLAAKVPPPIMVTGLFVDATDAEIDEVLGQVPLHLLQLHGAETPERVAAIRAHTGLPVMKALRLKTPEHLDAVPAYAAVADYLLFDSRIGDEPSGGTLPWAMLKGKNFTKPWMLAGGLNAQNLHEAVSLSGASAVDVSSGIEDETGRKSPAKIRDFLAIAERI